MTARHHHFLSQCYLRGFTKSGSKKSTLTVVDLSQNKRFETKPRNVGGIRDFNRVDAEEIDQNFLETSLAQFESDAASALKALSEGAKFTGEVRDLMLNLIALLAVRSPQMRDHMQRQEAHIADSVVGLALETKERWESQMEKMRGSGWDVSDNVTYEEMKQFHDSKAYTIEIAREHHIRMELTMFQAVLPALSLRRWCLIRSATDSGPFITTDRPVVLAWIEPEKIPPFYRDSPGFGLKDTRVYFPVSKNVALLGEFEGKDGSLNARSYLVATLNSAILSSVYAQVYAPSLGFAFLGKNGVILSGKSLLRECPA